MKVLVAPDKFKGTLTSLEAAEAIRRGLEQEGLRDILICPMADGGEGSHDALFALEPGAVEKFTELTGPGGRPVNASYLMMRDGGAFLETAHTIGLALVHARDLPPMERTSRGVGEWMDKVRKENVSSIGIFLGGSATVDGGFGLARALGFQFFNADGREITDFRDAQMTIRICFPEQALPPVTVYTDVASVLTGPSGSARIFAPQKGASPDEVDMIENRLETIRLTMIAAGGRNVNNIPGSGAAGGLASPLLAHPRWAVRVRSGTDFFLERAGLGAIFREQKPGLVISGEGCTDQSTLQGKVVSGLSALAVKYQTPLAVVSGIIRDTEMLRSAGFTRLTSTVDVCGPVPAEMNAAAAAAHLEKTTRAVIKDFLNERGGAPSAGP